MNYLIVAHALGLMLPVLTTASSHADAVSKPPLDSYLELMTKYPAVASTPATDRCVTPRLKSNPLAYRYRTSLSRQFKNSPPKPNFCGKYFVFGEPITGGGALFLSDCETGAVRIGVEDFADATPTSNRASCLAISRAPGSSYGPPRLYRLEAPANAKLVAVENPIQPR